MREIKDIPGYEGLYAITTVGEVFSYPKSSYEGKWLNPGSDKKGYLIVGLSLNKKVKLCKIHRLIGFTFIENSENKPQINHIDGNKLNNNVENLEWCTNQENVQHAFKIGLNKGNKTISNILNKRVQCIETGQIYYSMTEASRKTGIPQGNISMCCNGEYKTAGKYIWKYV